MILLCLWLALTTVSCLQLAEVEVYEAGTVASTENASAGKPTSQSSTGYGLS